MLVRIIKTYRDVVAICDSELLGKKFQEGKFQLDVKESFFGGEETTEEKTIDIIKQMSLEDATFNIVGKESIDVALKAEIISKEHVKEVQGVPFALTLI